MESILLFIFGAALLIYSAEKLIGYLVGVASGLRISVFLLAIIFTGIEFDDVVLGLALNFEDLDDVALGIIFGTALSLPGVVLALACILVPKKINIPKEYILIFAAAPLIMIPVTLLAPLTTGAGVVLLALFVLFLAFVAYRESTGDRPIFRDAEMYEAYALARVPGTERKTAPQSPPDTSTGDTGDGKSSEPDTKFSDRMPFAKARQHSGWVGLLLAVLALAGLVIGAATTGMGTEGILEEYGLEGTVFGATIATLVLTIEDIFLTVEPARKGAPEIGVGNVIGSVVFSVTGKLGIILLAGGIVVGPDVLSWHLPALIVLTGISAYFMWTGQLKRWHGFLLLGLYIVYWVVSFAAFGTVPADD